VSVFGLFGRVDDGAGDREGLLGEIGARVVRPVLAARAAGAQPHEEPLGEISIVASRTCPVAVSRKGARNVIGAVIVAPS